MSPSLHMRDLQEPARQPSMGAEEDPNASAVVLEPEVESRKTDWVELVDRIGRGDGGGMEELYRHFAKGVRLYLARNLGSHDLEDKVQDTFLVVLQAIRQGELREPERLTGFIRTVVRRQVASWIEKAVVVRSNRVDLENGAAILDPRDNPELTAIAKQHEKIVEAVLRGVGRRDREILTRFYLMEQTQEQICGQMGLSLNQFRLLKSRAKARFAELGRKALSRKKFS